MLPLIYCLGKLLHCSVSCAVINVKHDRKRQLTCVEKENKGSHWGGDEPSLISKQSG
eukprot:COSAG05_NODE_56_length_23335_cov_15.221338_14_plen_57_part_00